MDALELLEQRHSVRAFTEDSLSDDDVKKLKSWLTMINTHQQGLKFQLITDDPDPFAGYSRSYGVFTNPRNYVAAVVDVATPDAYERAGYYAEQFVIKALELGLGTCFVSLTYSEGKVKAQLRAGEKILFLILLGYPLGKTKFFSKVMVKMSHLKKMDSEQFFEPNAEAEEAISKMPSLEAGLEAVACAPSAYNKRPVRLFVKTIDGNEEICAKVENPDPVKLVDLGIAKYNYNFATSTECMWGNGAPLSGGESYL